MSEPKSYALEYRGAIVALHAIEHELLFATEHPEGQPTALFRFDVDSGKGTSTALDCGATAMALVDGTVWLAGTDFVLRRGQPGKKLAAIGAAFDGRIVAICGCGSGVAVVEGRNLHLVDAKGARTTHALEERGRSVAVDATGQWLVVGTQRGQLVVFDGTSGEFVPSASARVHDGEVTALAFAPDELRVYSAGTDRRLLLSFVRGAFDTEDRGGNNSHAAALTSVVIGPDFATADGTNPRLFTAALEAAIKSWPRSRQGSQRPATYTQGVVNTIALTMVTHDGKPHLAAAGRDGTIRVFGFDEQGRVDRHVATLRGAYADAQQRLTSTKPKQRETALNDLARYDDKESVALLLRHVSSVEADHKLMAQGAELLAGMQHERAVAALYDLLPHSNSAVRTTAFHGLLGKDDVDKINVLRRALKTAQEDLAAAVVVEAVKIKTSASQLVLVETLDHDQSSARLAALAALEKVYGDDPHGTGLALVAASADVRRFALGRVLARKLYDDGKIAARLRRLWDDADERVRLAASVVLAHRSEALVKALRAADSDFHRQLFELEQLGVEESKRKKSPPAAKAFDPKKLSQDDLRPLVEAMGARAADVSLRAARQLALLNDGRALGALLQLSRSEESWIRIGACRALAELGDPRAIARVQATLHDGDEQVRDAAFDALAALLADRPLELVTAGFAAATTSLRERALAALVAAAQQLKKGARDEATEQLFVMALNDADAGMRQQAFKGVFNLGIGGGGADTLRFLRQSSFADVRAEVLEEVISKPKDAAYRALQLELFDDPDHKVRTTAFNHARENWSSKELPAIYEAAFRSSHASFRVQAVQQLAKEKDAALRAMLPTVLGDEAVTVRSAVIAELVSANEVDRLVEMLANEHEDVRLRAAVALALVGDVRCVPPLVAVLERYAALVEANAPEAELAKSREHALEALKGIREIGVPGTAPVVISMLSLDIGEAAAAALPAIASEDNVELLRELVTSNSPARNSAALGVTLTGDPSFAGIVFSDAFDWRLQLIAALALREQSEARMLSFVDATAALNSSYSARNAATALVLAHELTEHTRGGAPERFVALLSAANAAVRLDAAQALERYGDQPEFYRWIYERLNEFKPKPDAWTAKPEQLLALSRAIALGGTRIRRRAAVALLELFSYESTPFEQRYAWLQYVYGDELKRLEKLANERPSQPLSDRLAAAWKRVKAKVTHASEPATFEEALTTLAFSAYVGLSRDGLAAARVGAVHGLKRLIERSDRFRADGEAALIVALGDRLPVVQELAFDTLDALGVDPERLIDEAMSTGSGELASKAFELMVRGDGDGDALLRSVILREESEQVVFKAEELLAKRTDPVSAWTVSLDAVAPALRERAVQRLAGRLLTDEKARSALIAALKSGYDDVRLGAAIQLAKRQQSEAYEVLVAELRDPKGRQSDAAEALGVLGDPRTVALYLQLLEAEEVALASTLIAYLGASRDVAAAPTLLRLIDEGKERDAAFDAMLVLTGYDQYAYAEDDTVTDAWEKELKPRHPALFAELLELTYHMSWVERLGTMVGRAKWPPHDARIDRVLGALTTFSDANVRARAIEIVGWRLAHREGPAVPLRDALQSREALDQFYAAEGLARAGHADGIAVLHTTLSAMSDWSLRDRAVRALGLLADESSVDLLLAIATDPADYAREAASEAIGHMGKSTRADEVFDRLKELVGGDSPSAAALRGLRWFGTPAAWALLRQHAYSDMWWIANEVVELLRYDAASVDVIADVLKTTYDDDVAGTAYASLQHIYGADSLEPAYLLFQARELPYSVREEAMAQLRERGEVGRLFDLVALVAEDNVDEVVPALVAIILAREPLPLEAAAARLSDRVPRIAATAAQVVGRGGVGVAKAHGAALVAGARAQRAAWDAKWALVLANPGDTSPVEEIAETYQRFVWALGQLQVGAEELVAAATLPDHPATSAIRQRAVMTLGESWLGDAGVNALQKIASGGDPALRAVAAAELERCSEATRVKWLGTAQPDGVAYARVVDSLGDAAARTALRGALGELSGMALPKLAARKDVDGLVAAARDEKLSEHVRRGALDALSKIPTVAVAEALAKFGADEAHAEELRKAAWRARRRVTRAVANQETP